MTAESRAQTLKPYAGFVAATKEPNWGCCDCLAVMSALSYALRRAGFGASMGWPPCSHVRYAAVVSAN